MSFHRSTSTVHCFHRSPISTMGFPEGRDPVFSPASRRTCPCHLSPVFLRLIYDGYSLITGFDFFVTRILPFRCPQRKRFVLTLRLTHEGYIQVLCNSPHRQCLLPRVDCSAFTDKVTIVKSFYSKRKKKYFFLVSFSTVRWCNGAFDTTPVVEFSHFPHS